MIRSFRSGYPLPLVAAVSAIALLVVSLALAVYGERLYREQKQRQAKVQTLVVAAGVTAPLAFDDRNTVHAYLNAMSLNPEILLAAVYDNRGALASSYVRGEGSPPDRPPADGIRYEGGWLVAAAPVLEAETRLGTVYLRYLAEPTASRLSRYGGSAMVAVAASLLLALLSIAQAALSRSNLSLERRSQELAHANEKLQEHMAERERVEAALRHSQKMDAIGQLTGGVAHDVNNHLQVIGANLQLLQTSPRLNETDRARIEGASAGVARAATLTTQLLAFARRQPLAPQVVNLGGIMRRMGDLLRRSLGEGVEVETIVSGGLWNVDVDVHQVENAVLNLAVNARDAMGGRGRLTLELGNASLDDSYARQHSEVQAGQYVLLAVSDTGCGMTAEQLERAFEPFFTTKPPGHGTGLGLSMVHGFVKQSGGHVKMYSEVGQGTTAKIYLPRAYKDEVAVPSAQARVQGGSETVLVVEDDAPVRVAVADMLQSLGYRTATAGGADAALAILESGLAIDLLFTDVVMPGAMSTPDFVRRAVAGKPGLKVLYTSGYTANAIVHHGRLDEGVSLLSKPYTREALAAKLRELLDSGAAIQPAPASRRVLLVEDELLVRMSTAEMLRDRDWDVLEAKDADEAMRLLAGGAVDLLITDLNLPGRSGADLAAEAQAARPGLGVIIASGQADTGLAGVVHLPKPYTTASLDKAIASALSAARA